MPQVTLFGPSARDNSNPNVNTRRLVNLFVEGQDEGSQTRVLLRSVQGMKEFCSTAELFVRAMINLDGVIYAVIGDGLFRIFNDGGKDRLGTFAPTGPAQISRNGDKLTITIGGKYYVWDGKDLDEPTPGAFDSFGSVEYLAGRTILTEKGGNRVQWSNIDAPKTLPGLNFGSAESRDDNLVRCLALNGQLMMFGARSTEIWSATGQGGENAIAPLPGATVGRGLKSFGLAVKTGDAVFMVGDDEIVYLAAGLQWKPISTPGVNAAIKNGAPSRCLYWEDLGHKFCAITFDNRPAWVFDIATGAWHERAEGVDLEPWRASCAVKKGDDWLIGGDDGQIYELTRNGRDFGGTMLRQATSGVIDNDGDYFGIASVEFGASYGRQTMTQAASLMLETSRDGAIWGKAKSVQVGFDGDFSKRAIFRALGRSRKMALRLSMADPCDFSIWADANLRLA